MFLNKIAIVLVNYRQPQLTIECVASIRKLTNQAWSVIIVDNNSGDGSVQMLRNACAECSVIACEENNGFAAGCNVGIRYALKYGAEYVLLLNNDTVVDDGLLDALMQQSDSNTVTVPKMYYYDQPDVLWYAGGYISYRKGTGFHYGEGALDRGQFDTVREIDFATGCCMLIPRKVLDKVGLMDESYFLYFEDVDYSMNFIRHGVRIVYCPDAKLWHKVSTSVGRNSRQMEYYVSRNRLYFLKKYHFSRIAQVYTWITRMIKYVRGVLTNGNEKVIGDSLTDYLNCNMGKHTLW